MEGEESRSGGPVLEMTATKEVAHRAECQNPRVAKAFQSAGPAIGRGKAAAAGQIQAARLVAATGRPPADNSSEETVMATD